MSRGYRFLKEFIAKALEGRNPEQVIAGMKPKFSPSKPKIPKSLRNSSESVDEIYSILNVSQTAKDAIYDPLAQENLQTYDPNIENYIGTAKIPIGIAGPLRVNGSFAQGDYYIPLATTEAALVGSYSRGCQLITEAGGCSAILLSEGVSRAPVFVFNQLADAATFTYWTLDKIEEFRRLAQGTTRHGILSDMRVNLHGSDVFLVFEYITGDASGQNMVTIATQAIYDYILEETPVKPIRSYIESNLSGDKKATAQAFQLARGKKVSAEVIISDALLQAHMGISAAALVEYSQTGTEASILIGSIGSQGHMANALAAFYIACGQDAACVGESATGITTCSLNPNGDVKVKTTLPNLMVGSIGGGTSLPSQKACLEILGIQGQGGAHILAEVLAGTILAGEISLMSAIAGGYFSKAHQMLARIKKLHG